MALVRIERLQKSFGGQLVLDVDALEIRNGEFFSLLGPSGCGKTTTLRSVAGLVEPDRGRIFIGQDDVTDVPTWRRNLGMVFQKYALFPHLTVGENIAYGLRERGVPRREIAGRVVESLALVALPGCEGRYPHQLSGGQQQRVAMARAVVYRPDVLLLDEPLSNLDVKLRVAMRAELKRLQQALGITTIFVTHDQQEALALSDRIAVMRDGRLEQVGTPQEIYESPQSAFVADFVGATNLLRGVVHGTAAAPGMIAVALPGGGIVCVEERSPMTSGQDVTLMVKPERVEMEARLPGPHALCGEVESVAYLGAGYSYLVMVGGQRIEVRRGRAASIGGADVQAGDGVSLRLALDSTRILKL